MERESNEEELSKGLLSEPDSETARIQTHQSSVDSAESIDLNTPTFGNIDTTLRDSVTEVSRIFLLILPSTTL